MFLIQYVVKISKSLILAWLCTLISCVANNLYVANIDVTNRFATTRNIAFGFGLIEVLERITAEHNIHQIPEIKAMYQNPEQYLQSYGYQTNDNQLQLMMTFNQQAINNHLNTLAISPWLKRPSILLWLLVDNQAIAQQPKELQELLLTSINKAATKHGLTINYPLYDFHEELTLTQHSNNNQHHLLEELSKKYGKEVTLIIQLSKLAEQWQIIITIYYQNEVQHWATSAYTPEDALANTFPDIVTILKDNSQSLENNVQTITINVSNLQNSNHYQQVEQYLTNLSIVNTVTITNINKNNITFTLEINQDIQQLQDLLEFHQTLTTNHSILDNQLYYRFNP